MAPFTLPGRGAIVEVLVNGDFRGSLPLTDYRFEGFIAPQAYLEKGSNVISMRGPWTENLAQVKAALEWVWSNSSRHRAVVRRKARRFRVGSWYQPAFRLPGDFRAAAMDVGRWLDELRHAGVALAGSYVNLGAADGVSDDPLVAFARTTVRETGGAAIAVELDSDLCARHRANLPWIPLACSKITTSNAGQLLGRAFASRRARENVDVLKLDVDSYEGPLLEELLIRQGLRPKLLTVEVNPGIPPPLQLALLDSPQLRRNFSSVALREPGVEGPPLVVNAPFAGVSISWLARHLAPDYALLELGSPDALFLRSDLFGVLGRKPLDEFAAYGWAWSDAHGFSAALLRHWHFELDEVEMLGEVHDYLSKWMEAHFGQVFPFALTY